MLDLNRPSQPPESDLRLDAWKVTQTVDIRVRREVGHAGL